MTQGELGRQFGVPFQMVQRWEQGGQLTIERIVAIAIVLKLDSTWLISGQYGIKPELCRALSETS
jgi:transcriptional regulator with XRE-family HTH domain